MQPTKKDEQVYGNDVYTFTCPVCKETQDYFNGVGQGTANFYQSHYYFHKLEDINKST